MGVDAPGALEGAPAGADVGPAAGVLSLADTVGGTMVGTGAAGRGAPVNKKMVPSTMLAATAAFKAKEAYQRQSRF